MLRILLSTASLLAACAPSPQKVAMPSSSPVSGSATPPSNPLKGALNDSAGAARGRRILSTAFVRVGPDGQMTVELQNGGVVVLRDVVMRPTDYCGIQVAGDSVRARYCGGYAEVAAARPGGTAASGKPKVTSAEPGAAPGNAALAAK